MTDLTMTKRYTTLADSDVESTHRRASPADHLGLPTGEKRVRLK